MLYVFLDILNFIMEAALFSAITVCLLAYTGRRSKNFLLIACYFLLQLFLELMLRIKETDTLLSKWFGNTFINNSTFKDFAYGLLICLMVYTVFKLLEIKIRPRGFIPPALIFVWLLSSSALKNINMGIYNCVYVPCDIFYFCLAGYALKKMKEKPELEYYEDMFRMFRVIQVFSLIILAEDLLSAWYYGFMTSYDLYKDMTPSTGYLKERCYSESILQIVLSALAIRTGSRVIVEAMRREPSPEMVPAAVEEENQELEALSDALGLSNREREVLPLLLDNLSIQEISERLFISQGTVKSHAHNIYQKAGVNDRPNLIHMAKEFREER